MNRIYWFLFLIMGWSWMGNGDLYAQSRIPVQISADGENRLVDGVAMASGNVVVRHGGDVLYCDELEYDLKRRIVEARGNVRFFTEGKIYRGERIRYNFNSKQLESSDFRGVFDDLLIGASQITSPRQKMMRLDDAVFSVDNRETPSMTVRAGSIEVYDENWVVIRNATVYLGSMPVFWWPYFSFSTDQDTLSGFEFEPGSRSRWGAYVLGTYNWQVDPQLSMAFHLDYRDKRGLAGGVDLNYKTRKEGFGQFKSYFGDDEGNDIASGTLDRPTMPDAKRYRFQWQHWYEVTPEIVTSGDINVLSDRFIVQDFFERGHQKDPEPDNNLSAVFYHPNFAVSLLTRFQANNNFNTVERKPELALEFRRQPLFNSMVHYEGESSVVNFERQFDRSTGRRPIQTIRYDTFHQISIPRQYFGWLNVTPLAGFRATYYTRDNVLPRLQDDVGRIAFNAGLESSFKFSRTWTDFQREALGIDGLRHLVEPFINVAWTGRPNERPDKFIGMDNRLPTTRQISLNYGSYNSIDSIDETMVVRVGARQKLQTRRDGANYDLATYEISTDVDLERDTGAPVDEVVSEIYHHLNLAPYPWLNLDVYAASGVTGESFDEVDSALSWQFHPAVELTLSHRFLNDHPFFEDRNTLGQGFFVRLNEAWQLENSLIFEADNGRLQEQRYTIHHDTRTWLISLTGAVRDHGPGKDRDEYLVFVSFTLKAFPNASFTVGQ